MKKNKVCLIIDNPLRDLDGLVLLAVNLAQRGSEVFLVPMYTQAYEIPSICPDFVLLNYARAANTELIKAYSQAGIAVGVLDTEGGIWESAEQFIKSIRHSECAEFLDLYCLWGSRQYEAMAASTRINPEKMVITGNPRYDFYQKPWSDALEPIYNGQHPMVLIISNFSLAFPRYSKGVKDEMRNMILAGYDQNYVEERIKSELCARRGLINVMEKLSSDFPSIVFVVRPHPFEDEHEYISLLKNEKNIQVTRAGSVAPWIKQSKAVLHLNSSTAIDTYVMGKIAVSLDWISNDTIRGMSELSYQASYKCDDYESLKEIMERAMEGPVMTLELPTVEQEIESWFWKLDGKASERVSNAILKVLEEKHNRPNIKACRRMALLGSRKRKTLIGWCGNAARLLAGSKGYEFLRKWIFTRDIGRWRRGEKDLSLTYIEVLVQRIKRGSLRYSGIHVTRAAKDSVILTWTTGSSIRISR